MNTADLIDMVPLPREATGVRDTNTGRIHRARYGPHVGRKLVVGKLVTLLSGARWYLLAPENDPPFLVPAAMVRRALEEPTNLTGE